jgi:hypothetical protein
MFIILALILVWVVLIASFSAIIGGWHWALQLIVYVVAGIVWIAPLKPLLRWMETGARR